jgi:subtilisin
MKKLHSYILLVTLIVNLVAIGAVSVQASEKIPVIVLFNGNADAALVRAHGGEVKYEYNLFSGIACSLPEQAINALERNPNVKEIELDIEVHALEASLEEYSDSWGVDRIDADIVHSNDNTGITAKVAILDTGIDAAHPDLTGSVAGWIDFVEGASEPYDDAGHGTHCAGIISAAADGSGVVGVAPDAMLYIAKVLNSGGSGLLSDVAAGIDWAVTEDVQVISMSLGADGYTDTLKIACDNAEEAGVLVVAAAGNDYHGNKRFEWNTVDYPGAFSSVVAVGATDSSDERAYFSSTGPEVELAAPGYQILSTFPTSLDSDGYAIMSGTSMACPHVAGTAALVFASPIDTNYDFDSDGLWDGSEVRAKLRDTAEELGDAGFDYWYGYGLVDAYEATSISGEPQLPGQVTGLVVSVVSSSELRLDWTAAEYADEYNIYRDDSNVATTTGTTYFDSGLQADTEYKYFVKAVNSVGEGLPSDAVTKRTAIALEEEYFVQEKVVNDPEIVKTAGRNTFYQTVATITVVDADDNLASGVTVTGNWVVNGAVVGSSTGVTDAGIVSFVSPLIKSSDVPTIEFVDIVLS